ncbi:MAG: 3-hydroxyacyl-CoA dehydrogenase family protein, partial [Bacteroidota bacterium]
MRRIKKAAVLGSGVMGSGIACHFANIGLEVLMLDIVPFDLSEEEKKDPAQRNRIVNGALKASLKSKPAPLYNKSFAGRITTGNFDDDFEKIADADWIIEVVVERLDIKKQVFEKVDQYRKKGSLVTSNTSGIPIHMMLEGRSEDFKKHFCGTHFFNPPRYLRLFEIIPSPETDPAVIDFFKHYGEVYLGKQSVLAKDTPAFIGNRIGVYSIGKLMQLTPKHGLSIGTADKLTGVTIGRPKTGTFRLGDLVGHDTSAKVIQGIKDNCPNDEQAASFIVPDYLQFLLDNKFYGNKSGQGFYKKTKEKDANGRPVILALNLETKEYEQQERVSLKSLKVSKQIEDLNKRIPSLIKEEDEGGKYLAEYFAGLFAYASNRIPEISDDIYNIDNAMKAGYAWELGPFEYWQAIGVEEGIALAEAHGEKVADWVKEMVSAGNTSFYKAEGGERKYYDIPAKAYLTIPGTEGAIHLDTYRDKAPVMQNEEVILHDIGDGVLCFEMRTKMNTIGE